MVGESPETSSSIEAVDNEFISLHNRFAESEHGQILAGRPRFERYRPQHVSESEWIELLGPDVDELEHHVVVYEQTKEFLAAIDRESVDNELLQFNERERRLLLTVAIANNWGVKEVGDINYEQKTAEDQAIEVKTFREVFAEVYGDNSKVQTLVEMILFEKEGKLGEAFNAIERTGYLQTALRAFEQSERADDPVLSSHLRWMTAGVLSNQIGKLIEYSGDYPSVRDFLDAHSEMIDMAFSKIPPQIFIQHGQTENQRREMYQNSRLTWEKREGRTERGKDLGGREAFSRGIFGEESNIESRFIPDYKLLKETIDALRNYASMNVVLTSGTFDMVHVGHAAYLEKASEYGSLLVVGVDSDTKVRSRKGPDRPMVPELERVRMLAHVRGVDILTLKPDTQEKWQLIKLVRPDTLIVTQEHYRNYSQEEIEELSQYCGRVIALEPQAETSTSARIRRLHIDLAEKLKKNLPGFIDGLIKDA